MKLIHLACVAAMSAAGAAHAELVTFKVTGVVDNAGEFEGRRARP